MLVRIAVVALAILVVIVAVRILARWQRPAHPPVDLGALVSNPGLVLFTSTDCASCAGARRVVTSLGVPVREVTWELEPAVMERIGVEAVPLTAVVDHGGTAVWLGTGVPRKSRLERAARRAGLEPTRTK